MFLGMVVIYPIHNGKKKNQNKMELKQFIGFKCKTAKIQDGLAGCAIFFLYKPAKVPILNEISLGVISIYGSNLSLLIRQAYIEELNEILLLCVYKREKI